MSERFSWRAQASYIWWMMAHLWTDEYPVHNEERATYGYVLVGWLVASLPIALGLPLGVAIALCDGYGEITEVLSFSSIICYTF